MTEPFDELPFEQSDELQSAVTFVEPTERKCSHPRRLRFTDPYGRWCQCGHEFDPTTVRRGRSSRRLGSDGERRSEKRYGWRKTGEFGGIDDLVGKLCIVQQKTTRAAAPAKWKGIFARLDERAAGRVPLILLSFVKAGVDTEDFVLVRGRDWLALHGTDEPD
jgi:hypothetical protein